MRNDFAASLGVMAFVAAFWVQRNYSGLPGLFVDPVMIIVFCFGAILFIKAVVQRAMRLQPGDESPPPQIRVIRSLMTFLILILWILGITRLGFVASSFLGIASLSFLLQTDRPTLRSASWTILISAAITVLVYVVFREFLYVQLPTGPLISGL